MEKVTGVLKIMIGVRLTKDNVVVVIVLVVAELLPKVTNVVETPVLFTTMMMMVIGVLKTVTGVVFQANVVVINHNHNQLPLEEPLPLPLEEPLKLLDQLVTTSLKTNFTVTTSSKVKLILPLVN